MRHRAAALVALVFLALPAAASGQAGVSYLIPAGNPFAATPGASPEIWAVGFRNPYRFSFDSQTGNLLLGDVGSSDALGQEEVNVIPSGQGGLNFGWPCREGASAGPQACTAQNPVNPIFTYQTGDDDAITGGYVVRERAELPDLTGRYLFTDYSNATIDSIELDGTPDHQATSVSGASFISFGEDADGRLYVVDAATGKVNRLVDASPLTTAEMPGDYTIPSYVAGAPGDSSRLFVVELGGTIRLLHNGQVLATPFLDLESEVSSGGERGMFSMAFPADYASTGLFYVFYTDNGGDIRIDELKRSNDPNRADLGSRRNVLTIEHSSANNHNGGQLQFGPDGYLYISVGDGGNQGDLERDAQNLGNLLGKVLRIDPTPASPGPALPGDTTGPTLRASARKRQRILRRNGVVASGRCNEACALRIGGRLRIGRRSFKLRAATKLGEANERIKVKAKLTRRARRALRRAQRRGRGARARITLQASDVAGNRSERVRRSVRARR